MGQGDYPPGRAGDGTASIRKLPINSAYTYGMDQRTFHFFGLQFCAISFVLAIWAGVILLETKPWFSYARARLNHICA